MKSCPKLTAIIAYFECSGNIIPMVIGWRYYFKNLPPPFTWQKKGAGIKK